MSSTTDVISKQNLEILGYAAGFLSDQDLDNFALASKKMRSAASLSLHHEWLPQTSSSFLDPIRQETRKNGKLICATSRFEVIQESKKVRTSAAKILSSDIHLLANQEWNAVGISNPYEIGKAGKMDRMFPCIQERKDENLIHLFDAICWESSHAREFINGLPLHLLSQVELADKIRQWMKENEVYLNRITKIDVRRAFPEYVQGCEKIGISAEINLLKNLDIPTLEQVLIAASRNGDLEIVNGILSQQEKIAAISLNAVNAAFSEAHNKGHKDIVKAFILCRRIPEIDPALLGAVLVEAATLGRTEIVTALVVQNPRFANIDVISLDDALIAASTKRHLEILHLLIQNDWFTPRAINFLYEVFEDAIEKNDLAACQTIVQSNRRILGSFLVKSAEIGHARIATAVIQSAGFANILENDLDAAFDRACSAYRSRNLYNLANQNYYQILRFFICCYRFPQINIEKSNLGAIFREAILRNDLEGMKAILSNRQFPEIPNLDFSFALMVQNGSTNLANALIQSNKFELISAEAVSLAVELAAQNGHEEVLRNLLATKRVGFRNAVSAYWNSSPLVRLLLREYINGHLNKYLKLGALAGGAFLLHSLENSARE